jgi:hypothetical protein
MVVAYKGQLYLLPFGLLVLADVPGSAQTKKLGDGLSFEGAGASFIGSGQTTTLDCAGGGAHILGSNNTLTFLIAVAIIALVIAIAAVSDRKAQVPFWGRALSRGTQDDKNFFKGFA